MSKFTSFTALQKEVGEPGANAIAEFMEAQIQDNQKHLDTKEDLVREISLVKQDLNKLREDMAKMEANLIKEISGKYNWLVAVLTSLGVVLTLVNKFL